MEVHAPLCPLDLRMTRCNVLQGAVHSKHGTVAAEAKTNKILLYKSTINATASAAHRGGRSSARNAATASSSSSSTPTPAATAFPAQPSTYSVLTTIPEDIRLVQWGIDLPGKLTPLLVASVRALYIYLVKSNGAVHSLAVRAPLDAAEVTSAAWHPTEPGMFAIVTMHGTFVYTLPHKVFASSFFGAAAPNSSAAAACDRVCAIKGKFRSCCWSGNGNHLIVAPTAASQDLRCYVRSSLQPTPDSDDDDGGSTGRLSKAEARTAFQAALQSSLAEVGLAEGSADAHNGGGQTVTGTQPGGLGIQLMGPTTPAAARASSDASTGDGDGDDADTGSLGSIDYLVLPGGGAIDANGIVSSDGGSHGGCGGSSGAQPLILEVAPQQHPASSSSSGGSGGSTLATAAANSALTGVTAMLGIGKSGGARGGGIDGEEIPPALAARFAAFENVMLTRLSALERSIGARLSKIEAAVCPTKYCKDCHVEVTGKFCANCGAPAEL